MWCGIRSRKSSKECVAAGCHSGKQQPPRFNADGRGPGLAALPGREVEFRACCAAVLNYFEATGLRWVHLPSGTPAPAIPLARSYATYLDNLRHALELFEPYRVGVLIEPINRVDIPGYFLDLPLARRVVAEVGNPNLRILFDVYHVAMENLDPAQTLRESRADIGHIQIADAPGPARARHWQHQFCCGYECPRGNRIRQLHCCRISTRRPDRGRVGVDEGAAGSAVMRGAHCAARVLSIRASALIALTLSIPCPAIPSARARCDRDRGNTFAGR